ncbi:helix-turn-helix domain-containing protein [Streptomyces sp. NPDC058867]|uniref:helix-turn-helix domain-containing protein n=1 Tax=unclassified Streptomyces TaxID=2593676 RepID=UPI003690277D
MGQVSPTDSIPFHGLTRTTQVGYVRILDVEADAQLVRGTTTHLTASPVSFLAFAVLERGSAVLAQNGGQVSAAAGDLLTWDPDVAYTLSFDEPFALRVLRVPRRALLVPDAVLRASTGTVVTISEGLGSALRALLAALVAAGEPSSTAVADLSADSLVNLLGVLLSESGQPSEGAGTAAGPGRHDLLARIRAHIDEHLADPGLGPGTVAKAHHISVRYLHRLFEGEGITVTRFIQQRRLDRCARELARRSDSPPTVSSVAQRWGFASAAHFSRSFRARHGHSPAAWRALGAVNHEGVLVRRVENGAIPTVPSRG